MAPEASIVIPTYNRRDLLARCLAALRVQTAPPSAYELVVVDDGSTDGTQEMVAAMTGGGAQTLKYLRQDNAGRARARNAGVRAAVGRIVIFLDSDMIVKPSFVAAHLAAHARPGLIAHGPVVNTGDFDDPTAERPKITDISRAFFATGNTSVERAKLLEAGLFDEDFVEYGWEDLELGDRLRALGLRAVRCPDAVSYHLQRPPGAADLAALVRREKERGHTAILFFRKRPSFRVRMMINLHPLTFLLDRLFLAPFHWTERRGTMSLLARLDGSGRKGLFSLLAFLIRNHAYVEGLREGLAMGRRQEPGR